MASNWLGKGFAVRDTGSAWLQPLLNDCKVLCCSSCQPCERSRHSIWSWEMKPICCIYCLFQIVMADVRSDPIQCSVYLACFVGSKPYKLLECNWLPAEWQAMSSHEL